VYFGRGQNFVPFPKKIRCIIGKEDATIGYGSTKKTTTQFSLFHWHMSGANLNDTDNQSFRNGDVQNFRVLDWLNSGQ
jgi:hypothetical protein